MKKGIALILVLTLVLGIGAVSASAETEAAAQTPSTVTQSAKNNRPGGRNNRQAPGQMPGNGQMPGRNNRQQPGNAQQVPGNTQQQPGNVQRGFGHGRMHGNGQGLFDEMLKEGVITQEVYDSIKKYLQEKAPAQSTAPAAPDAAQPAEGEKPADAPELPAQKPADSQDDLLKDLLASGVISQEAYDAITGATQTQPEVKN